MSDQTIESQAKIYVYDLHNCAREFGFKADEKWEVSMVTSQEKADLENKYFPTLSAKILPEMLAGMLSAVKVKLSQQLAAFEKAVDISLVRQQHLQYLVAYNPNRLRR
ncbi:hypothetical protein AB6735_11920 [Mucilaginibacter sp. RCC_168]|uniref:hypothetical protein n=1 Tax=Mucilaginibacter sp. RCC_168 TaxID=3239221 RepID=UPI003525496D